MEKERNHLELWFPGTEGLIGTWVAQTERMLGVGH